MRMTLRYAHIISISWYTFKSTLTVIVSDCIRYALFTLTVIIVVGGLAKDSSYTVIIKWRWTAGNLMIRSLITKIIRRSRNTLRSSSAKVVLSKRNTSWLIFATMIIFWHWNTLWGTNTVGILISHFANFRLLLITKFIGGHWDTGRISSAEVICLYWLTEIVSETIVI